MTNLKEVSVKIYKKQLLERLSSYHLDSISQTFTDFHHADVFFEKEIDESEFKLEFDSNDVLFEKTVFEFDSNEFVNSFSIESIDSNDVLKLYVSDH